MDRILSWKIDSSTYAYIFPINNSYISNRIPEDSLLWSEIINEISTWTKDTYRANFDKMASEVKSKYGQTILWQDQYWDFSDDNTNLPVNIVLLAGKDGEGYANGGNGMGSGEGDKVYDEFVDAINKELDKAKKDIEEQNKRVEEFVEQKVGETIAEAKNTIAETKKELADTRKELENKLDGAADALEKAAALFDMGEGGITGEKIQEALSSVTEYGEWLTANSGTVSEFKTDYDAAKRILGGVGSAEDASAGLFSQIGTTINDMDKTVGNVKRWMVASAATIGDIATWYDTNASAVTEASRIINASAGTITDAINFINGDGLTTEVERVMDAQKGTIKDEIMTETSSAVTNVRNVLNGLSGVVETSITRLDGVDGDLTKMGKEMDAVKDEMKTYMTVSDSAMTLATDLRDTWSVESGKLSTVASLTAQVDGEGNVMYFVSGSTDSESDDIRVWKGDDGIWRDSNGVVYEEENVIVHWNQKMGSYIQQQASSVTISVMNSSGLTAAIKTAIERGENGEEEESVIELISDKLVITGEMIANAISAKTANIGGILIGDGKIESEKTKGALPFFLLNGDDGSLYAQNAYIEGTVKATSGEFNGAITATSLTLGSDYGDKTITDYIDDKVSLDGFVKIDTPYGNSGNSASTSVLISTDGLLQAQNAIIHGRICASEGYFKGELMANTGKIGGFTLSSNRLMVSRDGEESIAYLNGSSEYSDGERGTIILAAGIYTGATTYYKYVTSDYGADIIYTKRRYSYNSGDTNNTEVIAYVLKDGKLVRSENLFYFIIEKANDNDSEDIIYIEGSDGDSIKYKQRIVEKSINGANKYYYYDYSENITDTNKANTILYEDGTLFTETIVANGGYFSGELNAKGRFRGELQDATGTLKDVTIDAKYLTGNIVLTTSNSLKAKNGQDLYFSVGAEKLVDSATTEYWGASEVFWERTNANGENAGQFYADTITITSVPFKPGATITIPAMTGIVHRYAPKNKTNLDSSVRVSCSYRYNDATISTTLYNTPISLTAHTGVSRDNQPIGTSETKFTALSAGVLTIKFSYNIHLSTYAWMGADKAYCRIIFNEGGSRIKVEYPGATYGTSIGYNGMRVKTNQGAKISAIDGAIELLSPNSIVGLLITDVGIKYTNDGQNWRNLVDPPKYD